MAKYALFIALSVISCKKSEEKIAEMHTAAKDSAKIFVSKDSVKNITEVPEEENALLKDVPLKKVPLIDSTGFCNYEKIGRLDSVFASEIDFKKIEPKYENFRVNYKLQFSEKFNSVVVSYKKGDHEVFAVLINLDKNNKIIDHLLISYDEIAESAIHTESKISPEQIIVTDWNYFDEPPTKTATRYSINSHGKFVKK